MTWTDSVHGPAAAFPEAPYAPEMPIHAMADLATLCPDGLVHIGLDGVIAQVNPAVERLVGWRPDVLCGRPFARLAHPDDRDAIEARIGRLLAGGDRIERITFRARRVDARYGWLELDLHAERDQHGLARGLVGSLRCVEERQANSLLERRRTSEHAALTRIGMAIAAGAAGAELDAVMADELVDALGAQVLMVHEPDPDGVVARCLRASWRDAPAESPAESLDEPLDSDGCVALTIRAQDSQELDLRTATSAHARGLALMWQHLVAAPVVVDGVVEAVVSADFAPDDERPDESVARVLGRACELIGLVRARP